MYLNSGYLHQTKTPLVDMSKPLIVGGCGTYRLKTRPKLSTWRPKGRLDYQLLYVAAGKTHFFFDGKERTVAAGYMVLYRPGQEQHYEYYGEEKPEVYWVHFTGSQVDEILAHYGICPDESIFYAGTAAAYSELLNAMIHEMRSCQAGFQELVEMYLRHILLLSQRTRRQQRPVASAYIREEIACACRYFAAHAGEQLSVQEYAASRNMSVCWFQRSFKTVMGCTPMQYLLTLRMNNAAALLETTDYSIGEIAAIIGYDDGLYFSRLFRKKKGMSPSEYRRTVFENGVQPDRAELKNLPF